MIGAVKRREVCDLAKDALPRDDVRLIGGGSGAAVAAGIVPLAHANDR